MDRRGIGSLKMSEEWINGLSSFVKFARKNAPRDGVRRLKCLCTRCCNSAWHDIDTICDHILKKDFLRSYMLGFCAQAQCIFNLLM